MMEKTSVEKTYYPKAADISEEWLVIDANGQTLGRVASQTAALLLGKHKPNFTPGVDTGTHVVVVNCEKVVVTGTKMTEKFYYRHSQYPGGLVEISLKDQLAKHPDRVLRAAVWGMLPHNKYGRRVIKKLKIYAGPEHPHEGQQPKPFSLGKE
jgi:large subunit ribosomal protein L13